MNCQCGRTRHPSLPFCETCYYTLPQQICGPIWRYECGADTDPGKFQEAVAAAVDYLQGVKHGEETTKGTAGES